MDLDTLLASDTSRKLFAAHLKQFNDSSDNLLTLYLICRCLHAPQRRANANTGGDRTRHILEKTYSSCFARNQPPPPHMNADVRQRLAEAMQRGTYNEVVFTAAMLELKRLLQHRFLPDFVRSQAFIATNATTTTSAKQHSVGSNSATSSTSSMLSSISKSSTSSLTPHSTTTAASLVLPSPYSVVTMAVPHSARDDRESVRSADAGVRRRLGLGANSRANVTHSTPSTAASKQWRSSNPNVSVASATASLKSTAKRATHNNNKHATTDDDELVNERLDRLRLEPKAAEHRPHQQHPSESFQRVNSWLGVHTHTHTNPQPLPLPLQSMSNTKPKEGKPQQQQQLQQQQRPQAPSGKITVAYYMPGEALAYISTHCGDRITLAQFKQLIITVKKSDSLRFFFKTKTDLLGEECVVFQEATDDHSHVPMFNDKVIAKIERVNCASPPLVAAAASSTDTRNCRKRQ